MFDAIVIFDSLINFAFNIKRGVAQLASAPALGAGGPWFESRYPDAKLAASDKCSLRLFYLLLFYHTPLNQHVSDGIHLIFVAIFKVSNRIFYMIYRNFLL